MNVEQLIVDARRLVSDGVSFLHQGRDPAQGLDCLGMLEWLGAQQGYAVDVEYCGYRRTPNGRHFHAQLCRSDYLRVVTDTIQRGDLLQLYVRRNPQHLGLVTDTEPLTVIHMEYPMLCRAVEQPIDRERVFAVFRFR